MFVYFAHPIDNAQNLNHDALEWVRHQIIAQDGDVIYEPAQAFTVTDVRDPRRAGMVINRVNATALGHADLVVAYVPDDVPTVGTIVEIIQAIELNIPVIVYGNRNSLVLAGLAHEHPEKVQLFDAEVAAPVAPVAPAGVLQWVGEPEHTPTRAYPGDAGFDLTVAASVTVQPGENIDLDCGVSVALPENHWGLLVGRSSALRTLGLIVNTGIIDNGYRGNLFVNVYNPTGMDIVVGAGYRVGQLIPVPLFTGTAQNVQRLSSTPRGIQGFGSTGK